MGRVPPQRHLPQDLLRDHQPPWSLNNASLEPYFPGGVQAMGFYRFRSLMIWWIFCRDWGTITVLWFGQQVSDALLGAANLLDFVMMCNDCIDSHHFQCVSGGKARIAHKFENKNNLWDRYGTVTFATVAFKYCGCGPVLRCHLWVLRLLGNTTRKVLGLKLHSWNILKQHTAQPCRSQSVGARYQYYL